MVRPFHLREIVAQDAAPSRLRAIPASEVAQVVDQAEWDALAADAREANPFLESWYLLPSLELFGEDGKATVLTYRVDGTLCGLMTLTSTISYSGKPLLHLRNWAHANMFLGTPLVRKGHEAGFWRAVLDFADAATTYALFLHLRCLALDGEVYAALRAVCKEDGRTIGVVEAFERPVLDTALGADAYRDAALSRKRRKEWRRQGRLLAERGEVSFNWHRGADDLERWTRDFLRLEASGWKGDAGSALACDAKTRTVFTEALARAAREDALIRCELTLDGAPIAMLVNFRAADRQTTFGFKTAIDAGYRKYSPGVLLENAYLGILDEDGRTWCDSCAAPDHPVMSRLWTGRRAIGRVSVAIGGPLRRAAFSPLLSYECRRTPQA